jgi:hypothetical protein
MPATNFGMKNGNKMSAQGGTGKISMPRNTRNAGYEYVEFASLVCPQFVLTVDTEEEFDWDKAFTREGHGTQHLTAVPRFQALCAEHGVSPCYLVDYPIAQDAFGVDLLGGFAAAGEAEIGVQLHPWVNPPFVETLSVENSYACNLPREVERAKLALLHRTIVDRFGISPDAYRAGRYGAGRATPAFLAELGIAIDTSVRSRFDYSGQGGPDYRGYPLNPYWLRRSEVMELPLTTMFAGALRAVGDVVYGRWFGSQPSRSALARAGLVERIALTPEGISLPKALHAIDLALAQGVRIINISFHSPSLAIGHTPYVRTKDDLAELYAWFEGVFSHLRKSGAKPTTMAEIKRAAGIATDPR